MTKGRLEAFSDGVIAIIITIMVLELRVPHGGDWEALAPLAPVFLAYVLSFVLVGIYWNNHHHMLHAVDRVNGRILWANQGLLFALSLVPFASAWMGEEHGEPLPTAVYGAVQLGCGFAYNRLAIEILREQGPDGKLARALHGTTDRKGLASLWLYLASVPLAFVSPWISDALFLTVALMWLVPNREIEKGVESPAVGNGEE